MMTGGGLEKKISGSIQLAELKKNDLEKSIFSLVDQWKEFEGELNLVQKDFCEGLRELDNKEQMLDCEKESLELRREWLEQRAREIRDRENDFALFRDKKLRDLEMREREFDRVRETYGKSVCEPLGEQEKRVEGLLATLKTEKLEVEGLKNVVEKRLKEIGLEEEDLKNKRKEAEMIEISIEERTKELKLKEEKLKEREKKAELKEEQLNFWKERQIEVEAKARQLQLTLEDLEFQEKKIDFIRKFNENRMEELDLKEKQLSERGFVSERQVLEEGLKDLESQKKESGEEIKEHELRNKEFENSLLEFHSKNEDFLLQKKLLEEESGKLQQEKEEFQLRVKQFELTERELEESLKQCDLEKKELLTKTHLYEMESKDLESKLKKFDSRMEELNAIEKVLEKSFQDSHTKEKQLKSEEKLIKEDYKHLESRKKELEERIKKFELKEKEFGLNEKKIESEKKLLEKDSKQLESGRKELEESIKKFECREKEFGLNEKKIESEKKLLEKDSKQLESGRKELDERIQKLELREKQLDLKEKELSGVADSHANACLKTEPGCCERLFSSNDTDLNVVIQTMGGEDLQKDHHLMDREEVFKALQLSKDPAKLVLDAMDGFYPPHLNKGNGEFFSPNVVRRSCMLLLQQLIKISPQIQPCVRDDALNLAMEWKSKLNIFCSLEVSAFLYLLGAYDLGSAFEADEIFSFVYFISVDQGKLQPELCVRLGLKGRATSFIKNLLKNNLCLEAITYIFGFELVDDFPPVPILKNYLKHVKMCAHAMLKKRSKERKAQNEFIDTRIAALRRVIKCIVDYNLESEYSTKDLENSIKQLLEQKKNKKLKRSNDKFGQKQNVEMKQILSTAPPCQLNAHGSSSPASQPNAHGISSIVAAVQPNVHGSSAPASRPNAPGSSAPASRPNAPSSSAPASQPNAPSSSAPASQPKAPSSSTQASQPKAPSSSTPASQPNAPSHAPSTQPKTPSCAPALSNTPPSHLMAFIIANMDGKNLISFLSLYFSEHELLRDEISSALQISYNSPKLVLDAVENLYDSYLTDAELKSCIFLLKLLQGLSPNIIRPDVKETAQNVALNWEAKLKARSRNSQLTSAYLLLISAYGLDSTLHRDELLNLYQMVAEQEPSIALTLALGIPKDVSSAALLQSQAEVQEATSSTSMVHGLDDQQSQCTDMDLEKKECVSVHTEDPSFINLCSDPAGVILDALRNCVRSNLSKNKSLAKSFYHLLEHLTAVSPEIKPTVKEGACEFFLEWKAKSIGSHIWETLGRLQLIAAYQLSSSLSSKQIFCLLEMVHPTKKIGRLIRMFGLVDKIPDFISELIGKKKLLFSFAYVYEFSLADMFPPVALLKQYVLYSKVVAKKIFLKGRNTAEAQNKSIQSEISALKNAIRLIRQHNLESEYSSDELRSTIKDLEIQRANLKKTREIQKEKVDSEVEINNNKRRRPTSESINEATNLQPGSKFRRSVSKSFSQFSNRHQIHQHPGARNTGLSAPSYLRTPSGNYSSSAGGGTGPLACVPQNEFLPSNLNPPAYNYISPPLWRDGNESSLFTRWCNHHNHQ